MPGRRRVHGEGDCQDDTEQAWRFHYFAMGIMGNLRRNNIHISKGGSNKYIYYYIKQII
jgi:hypothetical protein